jgi:ABC-type transport system involved in multi-copper enzyme maturation permease subunit
MAFRVRLFGPVLRYELVRLARRGQLVALRGLYVGLLLVAVGLVYLRWAGGSGGDGPLARGRVAPADLPRVGASFFRAFLLVQSAAVLLLTPALTAGAVAEERERRTLEFLLTTHLADREILLGKLGARLAGLAMVVLAGLPVLSLLELLGGVDPNLVLASFAATAVSLASLGAFSLLQSTLHRRARDAVFRTYAFLAVYLLAGTCCAPTVFTAVGASVSWPGALVAGLHPAWAWALLDRSVARPGGLDAALPPVLAGYAAVQGCVALVCLAGAARNLRREPGGRPGEPWPAPAVRTPRGGHPAPGPRPRPAGRLAWEPLPWGGPRPPVGDRPVLWKERHVGPSSGPGGVLREMALVWGVIGLSLAASTFVLVVIGGVVAGGLFEMTNVWARVVVPPVALLAVVKIAVRAAGSLSGEREIQTLDGLLTTPLADREIVRDKFLGSVLAAGPFGGIVGVAWALGLVTGGVHPLSFLLLLAAAAAYAGFAAALGLWCSLRCRTTWRATALTAALLLAVTLGHWLVNLAEPAVVASSNVQDWLDNLHWYALTPPVTLDTLALRLFASVRGRVGLAAFGVALYAAAAAALYGRVAARFGPATGRMPERGGRPAGGGRKAPDANNQGADAPRSP